MAKTVKTDGTPEEKVLLSCKDVAKMLSVQPSTVCNKISHRSDFPKPVKLFSRNKRWLKSDILKWAEGMSTLKEA